MNPILVAVFAVLALLLIVYLKVVRPVRGDMAWNRQTERLEHVKFKRLAKESERAEADRK